MKISKNKKNFLIGEIGSAIIFFVGVIFILIPNIYGLEGTSEIEVNDLFISLSLIIACVYFCFYCSIGNNPTNESVYLSIVAALSGILNLLLTRYLSSSLALAISVLEFTVLSSLVKLITIDYYHDRKDAFYYIEALLTVLFFVAGVLISVSLFNDPLVQTIELGFFLVMIGGIESINVATKALLKAPRFLGKIKF